MFINHKDKWVFIHIPKTGGSSIRNALNPLYDLTGPLRWSRTIPVSNKENKKLEQHDNIIKLDQYLKDKHLSIDNYFKFCFVRNPWDRCVSMYHYFQHLVNIRPNPTAWRDKVIRNCPDFLSYIRSEQYFAPSLQVRQLIDKDNTINIDYVGKIETFQQDFDNICDKIGIPRQKLSHKNKTNHKHYTEYYDDETRDLVAKRCARDIEAFGYKFGE